MKGKIWKITSLVSLLVFLIAAVYLGFTALRMVNAPSFGIIGGADRPTLFYVIETVILRSPLFAVGSAALLLCLVSAAVLLFQRFRKP